MGTLEICYILAFFGTILILREIYTQSPSLKKGVLPLCIISVIMLFSIIPIPYPVDPATGQGVMYMSISDIGLGLLPLGLYYLFRTIGEQNSAAEVKDMETPCLIVGITGIVILAILFQNSIWVFMLPPLPECTGDCFNPVGGLYQYSGAIFRLLYWMFFLPIIGIKMIKLILAIRRTPLVSE